MHHLRLHSSEPIGFPVLYQSDVKSHDKGEEDVEEDDGKCFISATTSASIFFILRRHRSRLEVSYHKFHYVSRCFFELEKMSDLSTSKWERWSQNKRARQDRLRCSQKAEEIPRVHWVNWPAVRSLVVETDMKDTLLWVFGQTFRDFPRSKLPPSSYQMSPDGHREFIIIQQARLWVNPPADDGEYITSLLIHRQTKKVIARWQHQTIGSANFFNPVVRFLTRVHAPFDVPVVYIQKSIRFYGEKHARCLLLTSGHKVQESMLLISKLSGVPQHVMPLELWKIVVIFVIGQGHNCSNI